MNNKLYIYINEGYLDQSNTDVVFDMSISLTNIFHDEITKLTTKLYTSGTTSDHNAMQQPLLLLSTKA